MSAHTPGPWTYEFYAGTHVIRGALEKRLSTDGTEYEFSDFVAATWAGQHEANARLIAAAPDMLELLQRFERFATGTGFVYPLGSLQELRQIIAKATGGAS